MKKAQVTLFVILGIVVVLAFGFLFFLSDFFLQAGVARQADEFLEEYTQSLELKTLVQSCLRTNTRNALWTLGLQGGKLYVDQDGTQDKGKVYKINELDEFDIWTELNLTYWAVQDPLIFDPPLLCDFNGPNAPNADTEGRVITCRIRLSYGITENNIQSSIANYINESLRDCVDIDDIVTNRGNEIHAGEHNVKVIFSEDNLLVIANYPFTISIKGKQPEIMAVNFSYSEPIRLQSMYNLGYDVMKKYVRDNSYVPEDEYFNNIYYREGLVLQRVEDYPERQGNCDGLECKHDLIWIKDDFSSLFGEPYILQFLIEDTD